MIPIPPFILGGIAWNLQYRDKRDRDMMNSHRPSDGEDDTDTDTDETGGQPGFPTGSESDENKIWFPTGSESD